MGLFEQRFSDEQVAVARRKIAAGTTSLRAAATEIGCAPSTLSVRIKKAEAAEAEARALVGIGEPPLAAPTRTDSEPPAIGEREGALAAGVGPVEVLRGALQATKANGQPDWPIRVRAAHMLAALRPEEVEPEPEPEPDSETVVYDLPPGSSPILHTAPPRAFAQVSNPEPPAEPLPDPGFYVFQGSGSMIPLVRHTLAGDEGQVHFLTSHEAAADILRAFGADPGFLDTIADADPDTA